MVTLTARNTFSTLILEWEFRNLLSLRLGKVIFDSGPRALSHKSGFWLSFFSGVPSLCSVCLPLVPFPRILTRCSSFFVPKFLKISKNLIIPQYSKSPPNPLFHHLKTEQNPNVPFPSLYPFPSPLNPTDQTQAQLSQKSSSASSLRRYVSKAPYTI